MHYLVTLEYGNTMCSLNIVMLYSVAKSCVGAKNVFVCLRMILFCKVKTLIEDETIFGGMIPKVNTALDAVIAGVEASIILDGRVRNALLLELFTPGGAGTLIRLPQ